MWQIPFNRPVITDTQTEYLKESFQSGKHCGGGPFTLQCEEWIEQHTLTTKALLTPSGTHALEFAALLQNINTGDEVILPSYTFTSTANAFAIRGASLVFVDIRPDTMNIDEKLIEPAITDRTKAIVPVHYGGVSCEMDEICMVARKYQIEVIEDAAQGVMASYKGRALGSIGDFGCFSFHETKNYSMGEGGALLINHKTDVENALIVREKGTNRSQFMRGQVDKYTWQSVGSSFLASDISAALLSSQLKYAEQINYARLKHWSTYNELLEPLRIRGCIELPTVPEGCKHNAHMFYIKVKDIEERTTLMSFLKHHGVVAAFHYVPLHSSSAGRKYGVFHGRDIYTTKESERLLRLPMFYDLKEGEIEYVCRLINDFYLG
ncbi:dTDP-4-amino-4,6-dideoxygalactose transaminase [Bacilliculturomica massiliensis]|uniref:dTDP-4-amino-4,6-dideoxygalactose transaminase n=1 Tax=Bacilliculturomica massiliensis TaxID=1917867 RepID=UPI001FEAB4F2|nr:dTDP-4-amino-4,6-dideoxygalactose transaminase [Bacilliculturomica massiliensis]